MASFDFRVCRVARYAVNFNYLENNGWHAPEKASNASLEGRGLTVLNWQRSDVIYSGTSLVSES